AKRTRKDRRERPCARNMNVDLPNALSELGSQLEHGARTVGAATRCCAVKISLFVGDHTLIGVIADCAAKKMERLESAFGGNLEYDAVRELGATRDEGCAEEVAVLIKSERPVGIGA